MTRVFLDANVLFSAAYREPNGLLRIWALSDTCLVSSRYAVTEAERNIASKHPEAVERLAPLSERLELVDASGPFDESFGLPEQDVPILYAAIAADATVLLTGDTTHFGHLFGTSIRSVLVTTPGMYLVQLKQA